jgi:hypothetical protein
MMDTFDGPQMAVLCGIYFMLAFFWNVIDPLPKSKYDIK